MKHAITTNAAPAAIGPYSQAVKSGELLFFSGQIPIDPASGELVTGSITAQAEQVLDNVSALLAAAGLTCANVVKTTIYLTDLGDFATVNDIYARYFSAPAPARACVQVAALPKGCAIEIEGIASYA